MQYIRFTKLSAADKAKYPTAKEGEYKYGEVNKNVSPPVDYWVEGYLIRNILIGESVLIDRRVRNGVKVAGLFQSSTVKSIEGNLIKTNNSVYKIEYLAAPKE